MSVVFGLAAITVHINVTVCPSVTLYGLDKTDTTFCLSEKEIYLYFDVFGFIWLYLGR